MFASIKRGFIYPLALVVLTASFVNAQASRRVNAVTASKMIESGAVDLILDVRDIEEFTGPEGRLKGAMLVPYDKMPASMDKLASFKNKTVLVYCAVGGRSDYAARYLVSKGFNSVLDLSGGILAWRASGLPTIK